MTRIDVIQSFINKTNAKVYLEIGVSTGKTLDAIKARNKTGVDPYFNFSKKRKLRRFLGIYGARLYEITSDTFFLKFAAERLKKGLDIAFIDGLHTYKQAMVDVENCLNYLNPGGIIVLHDCNPPIEANAFPVDKNFNELLPLIKHNKIPGWDGNWNGDVWKAIAILLKKHEDLKIFTLDTDWGLSIIYRGKNNHILNYSISDIENSNYSFLEKNRKELLNLKPKGYYKEFLNTLQ